ncbi:RagB/SusD family nutrient uptake outer membrane protein [Sinomicrobium pectinilyticum]|uniref:RagB/SusD family nutrient uptake outer membrane protein n=1 Tax=Sinomicrobium pectinilyticum TaxID=1084421 RepID=A0A3N0F5B5_SINP1|nr:RagB/SusD family nutrient uptake outer membrane protein [Sinomicrobium pectinilyticum]RNL95172.1 RagB/SusD family nutrient uptake outer membrane protein [Sinomicrobium pectinilyticum]
MEKKNIIWFVFTGLLFLTFSCDDEYLDRNPIDFLSPDNFNNEKDIREAVNGIYKAYISDIYEPLFTDFIVDDGYFVDYQLLWTRNYNNETPQIGNKWSRDYKVILRANTVLHYIDDVEMPQSSYDQYKGEALFLRALAYFDLSFFFGDVPLRTKPEGLEGSNKPLTPKPEILEMVLNDLETAAGLLPVTYSDDNRGRATRGAALAIKARALLFNQRYAEAADYCKKVRELGVYQIMPEYKLLFLPEGEAANKEVIFDMQFEKDSRDFGLSNQWYTRFRSWSGYMVGHDLYEQFYSTNGLSINDPDNTLYDPTVRSSGLAAPSEYIKEGGYDNRFQDRDPRLHYSLVVPYSIRDYNPQTGEPVVYYPIQQQNANFTGFKVRKYVDYSDNGVQNASGVNPVIIRYADILLMEAEALVEQGSYNEAEVYALINQVRQRESVMMPKVEDVEGTGLSPEELMAVIRHERRVEFAFEGLRIFDVMRWDIGEEVYNADLRGFRPDKLSPKANNISYEVYSVFSRSYDPSKGYQWPVPKAELDANKALTP